MQIQDAIHGYITLNELEEDVLDTPEMQRLRRIKQLGWSQLVYPSATHTRFEHSLGAMYLAGKFADSLDLSDQERQELRLAALLHDLGHGPFSHAADFIFAEHDVSHEDFSRQKILESQIADIMADGGVDPERVAELVSGDGRFGSIIAGHIDVDRMDYLMRDAHYTGVAYGTIDAETIIRAAEVHDDDIVFNGKYINALESLLTARYLMIPTVYTHRASRIASCMFHEAFDRLKAETDVSVEDLAYMDEPEIRMRLRQSETAGSLMHRIETRDLYKIAAKTNLISVDDDQTEDAIEAAIVDATGLPSDAVIADRMAFADAEPYDVPLIVDDEVTSLEWLSDLPATLKNALRKSEELRIYAPEDHVDAVADAADDVL